MRIFPLCSLFICMCASPLATAQPKGEQSEASQSPGEAGDIFVSAYMKAQQGEKDEQAGSLKIAILKLKEAASELDQIAAKFPEWNPAIVKFRKDRTAKAITRILEEISRSESKDAEAPVITVPPIEFGESVPKNWSEFEFNGQKCYRIPL